jgi:hypothetical protein
MSFYDITLSAEGVATVLDAKTQIWEIIWMSYSQT